MKITAFICLMTASLMIIGSHCTGSDLMVIDGVDFAGNDANKFTGLASQQVA